MSDLLASTTFVLTCEGPGGQTAASATVNVLTAPITTPAVSLSVDATEVTSGTAVTLFWDISNASSCVASGDWSGPVDASSSELSAPGRYFTEPLTRDSLFVLTCVNPSGSSQSSVAVKVLGATRP